jgi:peptide/nickel transport system permease protein
MSSAAATAGGAVDRAPRRRTRRLQNLRAAARSPRGAVGLALVAIVVAIAFLGPLFAPNSATALVGAPFQSSGPGLPFGTDTLGRDVLSRTLDGGWVLLVMAAAATALGVAVGTVAGVSAGYLRGAGDGLIMRGADVILTFPQMVFALVLVSIVGPKLWLIVLAVGITHAPQVARVLRAATLDISERDFVKVVELTGTPSWKIMMREILPNLVTPITVEVGLRLTYSIVIIAGLAFLGFGQAPPAANWGTMINENRIGISQNPWGVIAPAALIALLTVGMNTFTDALARVMIGIDRGDRGAEVTDPTAIETEVEVMS